MHPRPTHCCRIAAVPDLRGCAVKTRPTEVGLGAAIEFAMRGMTRSERARAMAGLAAAPSATDIADALATLVATLEQ